MLNPFPSLLIFGFFAPTLLRITAALVFFYLAYMQYQRRGEITKLNFPLVGKNNWWYIVSFIFNTIIGAMLLFGCYTQIAAILGICGQLKGLWLNRRFPSVVILSNGTVVLLIIICLSLLVSGAGAFAMDLPL